MALPLAERNLASLISEGDRMSWSKDAAPIYLGLAEAELAQGREQEALEVFEWYLGAAQRAGVPRRGGSSIPGAAQTLAARLPLLSDQTVLAYGALPDGLAIWVYDNRGVSAKWIPGSHQELQDLSAEFYAECSNPSSEMSALRRDSQALYCLLYTSLRKSTSESKTTWAERSDYGCRRLFPKPGWRQKQSPMRAPRRRFFFWRT